LTCPQFKHSNFEGTSIFAELPHTTHLTLFTGEAVVGSCDIQRNVPAEAFQKYKQLFVPPIPPRGAKFSNLPSVANESGQLLYFEPGRLCGAAMATCIWRTSGASAVSAIASTKPQTQKNRQRGKALTVPFCLTAPRQALPRLHHTPYRASSDSGRPTTGHRWVRVLDLLSVGEEEIMNSRER
jgi:hypothetical protein